MLFDMDSAANTTHKPNIRITQKPFMTFLLGTHKRLGKDSPIRLLNDDILYLIATIGWCSRQKVGLSSEYPNPSVMCGNQVCLKIDGCKLTKIPFSDISDNNTVYQIQLDRFNMFDSIVYDDKSWYSDRGLVYGDRWHNILTPIYRSGKLLRIMVHQYSSSTIHGTKIYMSRYDRDNIRKLQTILDTITLYNGAIYLREAAGYGSEVNIYIEIVDGGNV